MMTEIEHELRRAYRRVLAAYNDLHPLLLKYPEGSREGRILDELMDSLSASGSEFRRGLRELAVPSQSLDLVDQTINDMELHRNRRGE